MFVFLTTDWFGTTGTNDAKMELLHYTKLRMEMTTPLGLKFHNTILTSLVHKQVREVHLRST